MPRERPDSLESRITFLASGLLMREKQESPPELNEVEIPSMSDGMMISGLLSKIITGCWQEDQRLNLSESEEWKQKIHSNWLKSWIIIQKKVLSMEMNLLQSYDSINLQSSTNNLPIF